MAPCSSRVRSPCSTRTGTNLISAARKRLPCAVAVSRRRSLSAMANIRPADSSPANGRSRSPSPPRLLSIQSAMVGGVIFTLVAVVALVAVAVGALYGFRGYERLACRALKQRYEDLEIHDSPQIGEVALVYHTYHGVLAWFTQTEHRVYLPPEQARALLGRLFRFNLVWGLTARGG